MVRTTVQNELYAYIHYRLLKTQNVNQCQKGLEIFIQLNFINWFIYTNYVFLIMY